MKRLGWVVLLLLCGGAASAHAAYINWTGESFSFGTSGQATSGCEVSSGGGIPLGCYASFPDAVTTTATLPFDVPQDLPSPYQMKCSLGGYSTDGTASQYAVFAFNFYVHTTATSLTEGSSGAGSAQFQAQIAAQNEWMYSAQTGFVTLVDYSTGSPVNCTGACLGKHAELGVTRFGGSTSPSDNLTGSFRVTSVTCEY